MQRNVAAFIRTLPEFHGAADGRIEDVSQQLAEIITQSPARGA